MKGPKEISISDHALIRWLERGHGVDMEEFRDILREEIRPYLETGLTSFNHKGLHWIAGDYNGKQQLITVKKKDSDTNWRMAKRGMK